MFTGNETFESWYKNRAQTQNLMLQKRKDATFFILACNRKKQFYN